MVWCVEIGLSFWQTFVGQFVRAVSAKRSSFCFLFPIERKGKEPFSDLPLCRKVGRLLSKVVSGAQAAAVRVTHRKNQKKPPISNGGFPNQSVKKGQRFGHPFLAKLVPNFTNDNNRVRQVFLLVVSALGAAFVSEVLGFSVFFCPLFGPFAFDELEFWCL